MQSCRSPILDFTIRRAERIRCDDDIACCQRYSGSRSSKLVKEAARASCISSSVHVSDHSTAPFLASSLSWVAHVTTLSATSGGRARRACTRRSSRSVRAVTATIVASPGSARIVVSHNFSHHGVGHGPLDPDCGALRCRTHGVS